MDIQTRKISFVQEFLKLQNEKIILRFEKLLQNEKKNIVENDIQPMSIEEFNRRIDLSLEDSKKGRLTEANELISEIEKWR